MRVLKEEMSNDTRSPQQIDEMLRACAQHSWDNDRHRRQFEEAGIKTVTQLKEVLETAITSQEARSFDRQPDPQRQQTEHSTVFQAKLSGTDGKERQVTVILNPDRNPAGAVHGGTAFLNDPKRRTDISRLLTIEMDKGHDPPLLMRGIELAKPDNEALKSPISRLRDTLAHPPSMEPNHAREGSQLVSPSRRSLVDDLVAEVKPKTPSASQNTMEAPTRAFEMERKRKT